MTREEKHTHTPNGTLGNWIACMCACVGVCVCPFYFRVALGLKPVQSSRHFLFYFFIIIILFSCIWLAERFCFVVCAQGKGAAGREEENERRWPKALSHCGRFESMQVSQRRYFIYFFLNFLYSPDSLASISSSSGNKTILYSRITFLSDTTCV